ncbi:MAG: hypothetical protein KBD17_02730 [Candidatus Pacebacteria bacterium]|nr:hypothetical protein [Candidatus Paceibacterota bacterium]
MSTIPYRPSVVTLVTDVSMKFGFNMDRLKFASSRENRSPWHITGVRVWRELNRPQHLYVSCTLGGNDVLTERYPEWFQKDFQFKRMSLVYVPGMTKDGTVVFSYEYELQSDFEFAGRLAILAVLGHLLGIEVLHPEILQAMKESATFKTELCYQLSDSIVPLEEHWSARVS